MLIDTLKNSVTWLSSASTGRIARISPTRITAKCILTLSCLCAPGMIPVVACSCPLKEMVHSLFTCEDLSKGHKEKCSHLCDWGSQCKFVRDPDHLKNHVHVFRPMCPDGALRRGSCTIVVSLVCCWWEGLVTGVGREKLRGPCRTSLAFLFSPSCARFAATMSTPGAVPGAVHPNQARARVLASRHLLGRARPYDRKGYIR